ncbi:MAG: DUF2867 domain-containing protein [Acidobacteriota bacterium]
MRLAIEEHDQHSWWVQEYAAAEDLDLLDLWQFPLEGGEEEFPRFLEAHDLGAVGKETSLVVRALFALRVVIGRTLGWEKSGDLPFEEVHRDAREQTLRIENATVVALMHLGWVPVASTPLGRQQDARGEIAGQAREEEAWTAQLAVYARSKGRLGRVYLQAISPFRHHLVYPSLVRAVARRWRSSSHARA